MDGVRAAEFTEDTPEKTKHLKPFRELVLTAAEISLWI